MSATPILLSAGEASGDMYAARLATALKERAKVALFGMGGPQMRAAGVETIVDYSEVSVVGITEVLKQLPSLRRAMARLVGNLLDNALRYGREPVEITTRCVGPLIVLDIADRGPGIPADQVDRLKRPFIRGESARTDATGAGLGLAIVERIARMHGGTFDLQSRDGGGTLARVTLPIPKFSGRT